MQNLAERKHNSNETVLYNCAGESHDTFKIEKVRKFPPNKLLL